MTNINCDGGNLTVSNKNVPAGQHRLPTIILAQMKFTHHLFIKLQDTGSQINNIARNKIFTIQNKAEISNNKYSCSLLKIAFSGIIFCI